MTVPIVYDYKPNQFWQTNCIILLLYLQKRRMRNPFPWYLVAHTEHTDIPCHYHVDGNIFKGDPWLNIHKNIIFRWFGQFALLYFDHIWKRGLLFIDLTMLTSKISQNGHFRWRIFKVILDPISRKMLFSGGLDSLLCFTLTMYGRGVYYSLI